MNVEIAKQFAREKQLEFLTCDISDQVQVDSTFMSLIKKILGSWDDSVQTGKDCCVCVCVCVHVCV